MRSRLSPRTARLADALFLTTVVLGVGAVYIHYALRVATFQDDEELYVRMARWIVTYFPTGLWQAGIYSRGIQRLQPLLIAEPFAVLRGPGAFEVSHVILCLLFTSTSLPVFLLARRAGLGRARSYLASLLAIVMPWAVVSSSFLTESVAYPAFAWVIYGAWLTACEPSRRNEALTVAALLAAVFARVALSPLAPLLPVAIIWQTWRCEVDGSPAQRLAKLPKRLWSRNGPIMTLTFIGVGLLLLGEIGVIGNFASLTGSYGLPHLEPLSSLLSRDRYYLARIAAGTGYVTLALAIPWAVTALRRSGDARAHGLAVVCVLGLLCVLVSLLQAGPDERYVMYATVPVVLGFSAALGSRIRLGALLGAVLVVLLIDSVTWPGLANLYDYFTYPAAMFYARVLINHAEVLPLVHPSADRIIEGSILLVATVWGVLNRSRLARPAGVLLAAGVLTLAATQTGYALRKYSSGAGAGPPAAERSWVDRHVAPAAHVSALAIAYGTSLDYLAIWREVEFWNTSINTVTYLGSAGHAPFPLGTAGRRMKIQKGSGLLSTTVNNTDRKVPVPRLMLVPRVTTLTLGLEIEQGLQDPVLLLNLVRLREPARAEWRLMGTSPEGYVQARHRAMLSVYADPLRRGAGCAEMTISAPAGFTGRTTYEITQGGRIVRRGVLLPTRPANVTVPLARESTPNGPMARLQVSIADSTPYANGEKVSGRIEGVTLGRCPRAQA